MKRLTKTNFKTFIRVNKGNLFINNRADFDGMTDGIEFNKNSTFKQLEEGATNFENTFGLKGVWLVGGGRDYFENYEMDEEGYKGIRVSNCCGYFIVAIKKGA